MASIFYGLLVTLPIYYVLLYAVSRWLVIGVIDLIMADVSVFTLQ